MKRAFLLPFLILVSTAFTQETPAPAPPPPVFKPLVERLDFKDGDTLVFLGDSITHQCLYTQYVEDYFYTRYPKLRLHFHNAGVGGDRAADALRRFDEDVAAFKPKYVTVLLGMNDGNYRGYEQEIFDTYQRDMTTVLDRIAETGATAIPMTPTLFDSRAKRMRRDLLEPRNTYYNGVLALYGAWLREQAEVRGLGFVDMWSPLANLTMEKRKTAPNWTMIADGIHPGAAGQAVMAGALIEDMVETTPVSRITIAAEGNALSATALRGTISSFQPGSDALSFSFTAESLPWVLPPDAAEGAQLAQLGRRFSTEKLIARNLKPGSYQLKIDDALAGTFTDVQLASGIDLQSNDKTPQYQQALHVAMLNKQRNDLAYHPLRDSFGQLKGRRRDLAKAEAARDPELEAKKAEFETWHAQQKAKAVELLAKAKAFEDEIYAANQPQPRKYELVLVK